MSPKKLKTYTEVLAQYHLSSEDKFLNGQFLNRAGPNGGTSSRRISFFIGKEANQVGESGEIHSLISVTQQFNPIFTPYATALQTDQYRSDWNCDGLTPTNLRKVRAK